MSDLPYFWAEAAADPRSDGVDRLWLRQPGLSMADALLPGLTNGTRRARYYTVIAWMFTQAGSRDELRRLETAYVQALRWHAAQEGGHPLQGFGSTRVPALLGPREIALPAGESVVSVLDPAAYGPSASQLGLGARSARGRPVRLPMAGRLAAAAGLPAEAAPSPEARRLSTDQLRMLSGLCLSCPPEPAERDVLQELLFRLDRPRPEAERRVDGPRRRCLAVLLDAADGLRETPNARSVLQRLLDAVLGRPGWHAGAPFHEEAWGLGVVALRWYARHALEAVWAAVGAHLFAAGGPVATLDSLLAETLEYDDERDLPDRATRLTTLMDGPVGPVGAESDRYDAIEGALGLRPGRAILNAAIQLARLCGHTCRLAREDRYYLPFLDLGGVDRVSLRHLAQRAESTPTLGDWTRLLVERYAVSQHLRAATHKWATGSGAFNFRRTERGLELEPDVKPWSPEGGQTKVPVALSLFSDLGLVRVRSGRWVTTPRGRKVQAAVEAASR